HRGSVRLPGGPPPPRRAKKLRKKGVFMGVLFPRDSFQDGNMEILAKRIDMSTVKWISVVLLLGGGTSVMLAGPVFSSGSCTAGFTFTDALGPGGTTMAVAYDGVSYWSASGGSPDGTRYAQYSGAGAVVGTYP